MKTQEFVSKFKSSYLWGNIVAMIVVVILLFVGINYGLDIYTHHGEGISVPNLRGLSYESALRLLDEKGLKIEVNDSGYNRSLAPDCILAQTPGYGCKVKSGHTVYVTINSPHSPMMTIPDLIDNSSLREAQAKLTAMGFKLLDPEYVHGEKDWLYGIKSRGRNLYTGDNVSVEIPLVLQVGDGTFDSGSTDVDVTDPQSQDDFEEVTGPDDNGSGENGGSSKEKEKKVKVDDSGISDF
jgi:hypothetical protein